MKKKITVKKMVEIHEVNYVEQDVEIELPYFSISKKSKRAFYVYKRNECMELSVFPEASMIIKSDISQAFEKDLIPCDAERFEEFSRMVSGFFNGKFQEIW